MGFLSPYLEIINDANGDNPAGEWIRLFSCPKQDCY
jgi:hypothetical protein